MDDRCCQRRDLLKIGGLSLTGLSGCLRLSGSKTPEPAKERTTTTTPSEPSRTGASSSPTETPDQTATPTAGANALAKFPLTGGNTAVRSTVNDYTGHVSGGSSIRDSAFPSGTAVSFDGKKSEHVTFPGLLADPETSITIRVVIRPRWRESLLDRYRDCTQVFVIGDGPSLAMIAQFEEGEQFHWWSWVRGEGPVGIVDAPVPEAGVVTDVRGTYNHENGMWRLYFDGKEVAKADAPLPEGVAGDGMLGDHPTRRRNIAADFGAFEIWRGVLPPQ